MLQDNQPLDAAIKLNNNENEKKKHNKRVLKGNNDDDCDLGVPRFPSHTSLVVVFLFFFFFLHFFSFFAALSSVSGWRTSGCCTQQRGCRAVGLMLWTVIGTTRRSNKSRVRFMLGLGKDQREKS
jgi:hypothetical protein